MLTQFHIWPSKHESTASPFWASAKDLIVLFQDYKIVNYHEFIQAKLKRRWGVVWEGQQEHIKQQMKKKTNVHYFKGMERGEKNLHIKQQMKKKQISIVSDEWKKGEFF